MKALILLALALPLQAASDALAFSTILTGKGPDAATAVTTDSQGNIYVAGLTSSGNLPVTPEAFQHRFGGGAYDAFVAKLSPQGALVWATYLGGSAEDWATGIALDSAGNVWVCGQTRSTDFPLQYPIQGALGNDGAVYAAFVAKLDPTGAQLLYSTYLANAGENGAAGIALDSAGNAYVATSSNAISSFGSGIGPANPGIEVTKLTSNGALVYSYVHIGGTSASAIAVDSSDEAYVAGQTQTNQSPTYTKLFGRAGLTQAMVFKLSADGSTKLWETALGGSDVAAATALAIAPTGEAWVGGYTTSSDFPLVNPLQSTLGARPVWVSTNFGAAWSPLDNLPFPGLSKLVPAPSTPTTLYVSAEDLGIFKSLDSGATWNQILAGGYFGTYVTAFAVDPVHPQILYAATANNQVFANAVLKSTDGGSTWTQADSPPAAIGPLVIDGQNDNNVYALSALVIRKSDDGGATWNALPFPGGGALALLPDPQAGGHLVAVSGYVIDHGICCGGTFPGPIYRSVDEGATWTQATPAAVTAYDLMVDTSTNPSTFYDGLLSSSSDGGVTWAAIPTSSVARDASAWAIDSSGTVYATVQGTGLFASHDHARTWTAIGSPIPPFTLGGGGPSISSIVPDGPAGTVYTSVTLPTNESAGFLSKLSADGSTLEYSTYLRGHEAMTPYIPDPMAIAPLGSQNYLSAIAFDPSGNVVTAGATRTLDFPTANPFQAANAGYTDAFLTTISADGARLLFSTYLGGLADDGATAAAVDSKGNLIVAGQTYSMDFPVTAGTPGGGGNAFIAKVGPATAPVISTVLNGASYQPGIEAGSWVMIQGSNLADTTRLWRPSDFNGNDLPTQLSGTSVTIDGIPAYVEYISPTQINVLAPADPAIGTVNVVVTNNGSVSSPATAQLQSVAPALFMSASSAIASVIPGYIPVTASKPALPGNLVVLWCTGLGPTNPPTVAGTIVSGAPPTATTPIVTVGGMQVPVISSVLTTGTVGLYQITIQLPANVPTGTPAVQASIGGAQTQSGVTLFVGAQ